MDKLTQEKEYLSQKIKEDPITGILNIGNYFIRIYTIWLLWEWFLVPLGLPMVSYLHIIGLSMVIGMLFPSSKPKDQLIINKAILLLYSKGDETKEKAIEKLHLDYVMVTPVAYVIVVIIGYFVSLGI